MHFHADFGFVQGSDFRLKTHNGKTIPSIWQKELLSHCWLCHSLYLGLYQWFKGTPCYYCLEDFDVKYATHRTFRTDQDKDLNLSHNFRTMIVDSNFTVKLTGPDLSDQNGIAERLHWDLGQMMIITHRFR